MKNSPQDRTEEEASFWEDCERDTELISEEIHRLRHRRFIFNLSSHDQSDFKLLVRDQNGRDILLRFNRGDNVYDVATKFISQHDFTQSLDDTLIISKLVDHMFKIIDEDSKNQNGTENNYSFESLVSPFNSPGFDMQIDTEELVNEEEKLKAKAKEEEKKRAHHDAWMKEKEQKEEERKKVMEQITKNDRNRSAPIQTLQPSVKVKPTQPTNQQSRIATIYDLNPEMPQHTPSKPTSPYDQGIELLRKLIEAQEDIRNPALNQNQHRVFTNMNEPSYRISNNLSDQVGHSLKPCTNGGPIQQELMEEKKQLEINSSLPITTLRIVLHTGERLNVKCNTCHTIADIYQHVNFLQPKHVSFVLKITHPSRILDDKLLTIEAAQLLNAVLYQSVV